MPHIDDHYVHIPEACAEEPTELPRGVVRVGENALASSRLLTPELVRVCNGENVAFDEPVRIAAFDFDGTSITGNSPVILVRYLVKRGMLKKGAIARIMAWAAAYKLRLPQNESWVRTQVFSAFRGKPVCAVNRFLRDFYDECVAARFRDEIDELMDEHIAAGHVVVCVSATFEPIIAQAMARHPIQLALATRMQVDDQGRYTDQVEGLPVEGEQKISALTAFADGLFGAGKWELSWAYGDHHSDRAMLAAAKHPCAVTPDRPLGRTARECGYDVLEIDED